MLIRYGYEISINCAQATPVVCLLSAHGERAGDIRHSLADASLAAERLGFRATTPFEEGLRRTMSAASGDPIEPTGRTRSG